MYATFLVFEVFLIVFCFYWLSTGEECKSNAELDGRRLPCDEATYLFFIFYLDLAKDLAFLLTGVRSQDWSHAQYRVSGLYMQCIGSMIFFAFTSSVSCILYALQPTDHPPRRLTYLVFGSVPNLLVVLDCSILLYAAWRRGYKALFPNADEVKHRRFKDLTTDVARKISHDNDCTICLDTFRPEDSVTKLPCGHVFHTDCVLSWFQKVMACPIRCKIVPVAFEDHGRFLRRWEKDQNHLMEVSMQKIQGHGNVPSVLF